MWVLITKLVRKTASSLGLVIFVTYDSSQFARDIRYLEFGLSLDGSYSISHHVLTILSVGTCSQMGRRKPRYSKIARGFREQLSQ